MSIPEQQPSQSFAPHEAATLTGVSVHSIRRWCEYHAPHLSPRANPEPGVQRRLTPRDVEVMKHVKSLREDGLSVNLINEKLAGLTFAEIDANPITEAHALALQDAQDNDTALGVALHAIATMQHDMASLKQSVSESKQSQRDYMQGLAVGFVGALLFVILLLLLFMLRNYL